MGVSDIITVAAGDKNENAINCKWSKQFVRNKLLFLSKYTNWLIAHR